MEDNTNDDEWFLSEDDEEDEDMDEEEEEEGKQKGDTYEENIFILKAKVSTKDITEACMSWKKAIIVKLLGKRLGLQFIFSFGSQIGLM